MPAPFQVQTRLTTIAMAAKPMGFIADMVCPRRNARAEQFTYTKSKTEDFFTIPDTRIGRASEANTVEFGSIDVDDSVEDHGLKDVVPIRDINVARAQRANWDPLGEATEGTALLVHLARERRASNLIFGRSNYLSGNAGAMALSGNSQWSDDASDPLTALEDQIDKMLIRPTDVVFGQSVWTKFRRHPKVVAAIKPSGAGDQERGRVTRRQVAEELELTGEVHVGQTWFNSAAEGQTAVYERLWGKHCALITIDKTAQSTRSRSPTFAITAQWMGMRTDTYENKDIGTDGAVVVKVVDQVKELVTWKEAGYLFQNAVA